MTSPSAPDLIGAADAAQILGVDRRQLTRLVRSHSLPIATKLPGRTGAYLFERREVDALRQARDETRPAP